MCGWLAGCNTGDVVSTLETVLWKLEERRHGEGECSMPSEACVVMEKVDLGKCLR